MLTEQKYINALCCNARPACEHLDKTLTDAQRAELELLLCPPPDAGVIESRLAEIQAELTSLVQSGLVDPERLISGAHAIANPQKGGDLNGDQENAEGQG